MNINIEQLNQVVAIELQNINLNAVVSAEVLQENASRVDDQVLHQLFSRMARARRMLASIAEQDLKLVGLPKSNAAEVDKEIGLDFDKRMTDSEATIGERPSVAQDMLLLKAALKQDQKLHRCIKRFVKHESNNDMANHILWIEADIGRLKMELNSGERPNHSW